jgi:DNA modification methylase
VTVLRGLDGALGVCITSPPYFQKFDCGLAGQYGIEPTVSAYVDRQAAGQYGIEPTVSAYVDRQVMVFHEINRLQVQGGTLFIVIGDTSNNYSPVRAKEQRKGTDGQWLFRRSPQKEFREKETLSVPPEGCGVIDPYVGSGTVLRSARKTNRPFLGIDLDISLARAAAAEGSLSALPLFAEAAD